MSSILGEIGGIMFLVLLLTYLACRAWQGLQNWKQP